MKLFKRLFNRPAADEIWLRQHHVPLKKVAHKIRFYCRGKDCHHWYSVTTAVHIGFHCHRCHGVLDMLDDF